MCASLLRGFFIWGMMFGLLGRGGLSAGSGGGNEVLFDVVTWDAPASSGNLTINCPNIGNAPVKGIITKTSRATADRTPSTGGMGPGFGAYDGTNQIGWAIHSNDNVATANTAGNGATNRCGGVITTSGLPALNSEFTGISLGNGGFTINYAGVPTSQMKVTAAVFAGNGARFACGKDTMPGPNENDTVSLTGLSFAPEGGFFGYVHDPFDNGGFAPAHLGLGFGGKNSSDVGWFGVHSENNPSALAHYASQSIPIGAVSTTDVIIRTTIDSWNGDGLTLRRGADASSAVLEYGYCLWNLAGMTTETSAVSTNTSTGVQTYSRTHNPKFAMFLQTGNDAWNTLQTSGKNCISTALSFMTENATGTLGWQDDDAQSPTNASTIYADDIYYLDEAGAVDAIGNFDSFGGSLNINWTNAPASAFRALQVTIG